ncbi:alkaline phosphatase family protein [Botrimarina sp.]|uniref:alkaline phosphatase family protein n=1 Tax=Botrimarina sp. TaxID=2795802 RepID=UPI0032EAE0D3
MASQLHRGVQQILSIPGHALSMDVATEHPSDGRPVLLIIIDGLSARVAGPAIDRGELPFLQRIDRKGGRRQCISIFPSITPAATASLATGVAPAGHGIQGAFWYDRGRDAFLYFGDSPRVVLREGVNAYFDDYLRTLNDELLVADTLFERAQAAGLTAANLNYMWRRGMTEHPVDQPLLFTLIPGVALAESVKGPDWLFLGDFVKPDLPGIERLDQPGGASHRFGFNDAATLAQLGLLQQSGVRPDLTVAYFPDNDFLSHSKGPEGAFDDLRALDRQLFDFFELRGGVDALLETTEVIVVGDHGHDRLLDDPHSAFVRLDDLLADWRQALPGGETGDDDQLAICTNMRAAQIVPLGPVDLEKIESRLLSHDGVDLVVRAAEGHGLTVATRSRGRLTFSRASDGDAAEGRVVRDANGVRWSVDGDLSALNATIDSENVLRFGDYPDALGRLADGSPSLGDAMWLSAAPGYEFTTSEIPTHSAGSHGSLHRSDSETLLVATGGLDGFDDDSPASITDIASMCLKMMGVSPSEPVAERRTVG